MFSGGIDRDQWHEMSQFMKSVADGLRDLKWDLYFQSSFLETIREKEKHFKLNLIWGFWTMSIAHVNILRVLGQNTNLFSQAVLLMFWLFVPIIIFTAVWINRLKLIFSMFLDIFLESEVGGFSEVGPQFLSIWTRSFWWRCVRMERHSLLA